MSEVMNTTQFDKILVVDDAAANLRFLTNLLTEHGYTVYPASAGELALEFVQSRLPDLILLDIRMPGMDGYEVCRRLKAEERTRDIPIMFISILEDERDKVKGFQAGAVDYITKPFQPEEVLARIRTHLRLRELTDHLEHTVAERTAELRAANAQLQIELVEHQRAEAALRESEEKYRTLIQKIQAAVVVHGSDTGILTCNSLAQALLGLSEEQLLGKTAIDPAWHFFREDGTIMPAAEYPVNQVLATRQPLRDFVVGIHRPNLDDDVWGLVYADPVFGKEDDITQVIVTFINITERKRAEEALRKSEVELKEAQRLGRFGSWDWDAVTDTITWSEEYYHIYGFDPTQRPPGYVEHLQAYTPESAARLDAAVKRNMETGEPYMLDLELARPDGPSRWITARSETKHDTRGRIVGLRGTAQDITERKRAEEVLRISEERYRMAQALGHVGNWEYNLQTTQFWGSDEAKRIYGFDPEQANFSTDEVENCIPERERVHQALVDLIEAGKPYNLEFEIHPLNSSELKIITSIAELQRDEHGDPLKVIGVIQDVTTRKRAEEALQRKRSLLANIMETSPIGITTVDVNGQITFANTQAIKTLGLTKAEIIQRTYNSPAWRITDFAGNPFPVEELPFVRVMTTGQAVHDVQHAIEWPDGQRVLLSINAAPLKNEADQIEGMVAVISDITERKRAEEAEHRLNRELRALSTCNQALIRAVDEHALLNDICRIVCDVAGYRMVWVGYAEHDDAQTVRPVAWAGIENGYLAAANITWADTERGHGPTGIAIRTGESTCIQDFMTDLQAVPWRENALPRGYRSGLALPLKDENASTFGALNIYAAEPDVLTSDEIRLLEELSGDLAFGIVTLRTRAERKRAEETLRESERLLAEIAANYPNSYLSIIEKDLTIGFTSGQEFKKQHLDSRSFIGLSLEQVFGEQTPIVREHYLKTFQGEETSFELFIHNQYQLYNVVPLYDQHGQITRILAVVENITTRKQAERELQRSNDLLRAIIEAAPTAIIGLDLDGNVQTVWNPAAEKMLGWSAQEAMGHFLPSVPVESQEEFRHFREWIRSGQILNGVEVRRQKRDGSPIDYSIYASPLHDAEGQITGNVSVLVDITERKRAEAEINKLTRAVEQSPTAIVITDTAGNIEYVNPRFTQITGYTSAEVLGQNPRILKSGETPPEEYQRLWEIITHGDVWRGEFHNKKKTGDLYWESASISPVIDAQGNITHFVAVKEDITARKQTEEALRILNEELELRVSQRTAELVAANKELKEFAHIVSHDLKAPLRGISRLTQWLQEDYAGVLDTQGQEQLDLLGEQVKRMNILIDGILRYSRAGHGGERKESIELNTLVAQVIEMLMPPVHITIQCENMLPVIHGDPIQLMQIFQNLLSNAVKFMDKPAGKITVASEDGGDVWIFRVEDNGPGIEPRHHERIFKIFQSCTTRDERESTGIGLAVVKKIVELYGGRVWVESTPGQGSRFSFTWPKRTSGED